MIAAQDTAGAWTDLDRKYIPFMAQHDIQAMLVRPDFYLYGAASTPSGVGPLIDDLAADLERHGVCLAVPAAV